MIQGDGFKLRPFMVTDTGSLAKYANNKNISDNLRDKFPYPYTEGDAQWFINHVLSDNDPVRNFVIEINQEAAGAIGLIPGVDVYRLNAEIGYWLAEKYWGKGIITAVIKATVKYAFENIGIRRLYAVPFSTNIGSVKALERSGFIKEATIRNGAIKNNKILDYYIYSVTNFQES